MMKTFTGIFALVCGCLLAFPSSSLATWRLGPISNKTASSFDIALDQGVLPPDFLEDRIYISEEYIETEPTTSPRFILTTLKPVLNFTGLAPNRAYWVVGFRRFTNSAKPHKIADYANPFFAATLAESETISSDRSWTETWTNFDNWMIGTYVGNPTLSLASDSVFGRYARYHGSADDGGTESLVSKKHYNKNRPIHAHTTIRTTGNQGGTIPWGAFMFYSDEADYFGITWNLESPTYFHWYFNADWHATNIVLQDDTLYDLDLYFDGNQTTVCKVNGLTIGTITMKPQAHPAINMPGGYYDPYFPKGELHYGPVTIEGEEVWANTGGPNKSYLHWSLDNVTHEQGVEWLQYKDGSKTFGEAQHFNIMAGGITVRAQSGAMLDFPHRESYIPYHAGAFSGSSPLIIPAQGTWYDSLEIIGALRSGGSLKVQVNKPDGSLVPDSEVPGNSQGFSISSITGELITVSLAHVTSRIILSFYGYNPTEGVNTAVFVDTPEARSTSGPPILRSLAVLTTATSAGSPPTLTLSYLGRLYDKVGTGEQRLSFDNSLDGTYQVVLGGGARTVTRLELRRGDNNGIWDTIPNNVYWSLGVSTTLGGPLVNSTNDAVNFAMLDGGSFYLYTADFVNASFPNGLWLPGSTFTLTATFSDNTTATASVTIGASAPTLSSIALNTSSVVGGNSVTGTAMLTAAAPTGGAVVTLSSSDTSVASVAPTSVTVAAGQTSATFTVNTSVVSSAKNVTIMGTYAGVNQTASLAVNPVVSQPSITLSYLGRLYDKVGTGEQRLSSDNSLDGTFQVVLGGGVRTITQLALRRSDGTGIWDTIPNNVYWSLGVSTALGGVLVNSANDAVNFAVPAGGSFYLYTADFVNASFPNGLLLPGFTFTLTVSFSDGTTATAQATTSASAPTLSSIALNTSSVVGGNSVTGTATLTAVAPATGAVVTLTSSDASAATVPASVTVPVGQTSATFLVNTSVVSSVKNVTITGTYANASQSAALTVNPASQPTNLAPGKPTTASSILGPCCGSPPTGFPYSIPNGFVPGFAVDGDLTTLAHTGWTTDQQRGVLPWWQVDLSGSASIKTIQLWRRTDCCPDRLSDFYVFVSDTQFVSEDLNAVRSQPGVSSYPTAGPAGTPTTITVNRTGRYVRVQLTNPNTPALSIAEVQVIGSMP